ncbi:MAG: phosphatidylglycerol lysyltransferase domain-containing protein [Bacteroidales bacterium]
MELPFRRVTKEDRDLVRKYTLPGNASNCDLAFSNICSWSFLYETELAVVDGFLLFRFKGDHQGRRRTMYMYPLGHGDIRSVIDKMERDSLSHQGEPLMMLGVLNENKNDLERCFPGGFLFFSDRNYFDYVYLRTELAALKGKKHQTHRNHINRFKALYSYEYVPLTPDLVPECLMLESKWVDRQKPDKNSYGLSAEQRSMHYALQNMDDLDIIGGVIKIDGRVAAFSFGSPVTENTFVTHVEKGDISFDGIYSIMNQEMAAHLPEQYIYINREEDLGLEGLRHAKLSYHPEFLLEKWAAVKKPHSTFMSEIK